MDLRGTKGRIARRSTMAGISEKLETIPSTTAEQFQQMIKSYAAVGGRKATGK